MSDSAVFMAPIPVTPAIPALISRLVEQFDATWIDADNLDAWLAEGGDCLLLLCGDPVRHPECLAVAVVLPELMLLAALYYQKNVWNILKIFKLQHAHLSHMSKNCWMN